jgi:RES domain-containing protein
VDLTTSNAQRALGIDDDVLRSDWKAIVAAGRVPITHDIEINPATGFSADTAIVVEGKL